LKRFIPVLSLVLLSPVAAPSASKADGDLASSVLSTLDSKVDPCDDFYQYACGGWLSTFKLPADEASYARSFSSIDDRNLDLLHDLLENASKATDGDPDWRRIGDTYGSCMDESGIEARGHAPIDPWIAEIAKVKKNGQLMSESGKLGMIGVNPLFNVYVQADYKDPNTDLLYIGQGGLGLPDRDYYLRDDDDAKKLRDAYKATIEKTLVMIGDKTAAADAASILAFETELAKIQKPQDELRDPTKTYHRMDAAGLQALTPNLPWNEFFTAAGQPGLTAISVDDPDYITAVGKLVDTTGAKNLKAYLDWQLLMGTSKLLGKEFVDEHFAFFGQALSGQQQDRPRWKKCVDQTNDLFPEIVGKYYVEKAFPGDSKAQALAMIQGIEGAFQGNLAGLTWMDDPTRQRATEKMKMITNKIGYPDKWRDYSAVSVAKGTYFENVLAGRKFESARQIAKVGKPVDKTEWGMPPAMVNAYYDPTVNEIVFPAGILQTPFFSATQPPAMNWGAMGMVMGHELTHGFDDQGAKFDGTGKMVDWWAPDVVTRFGEQTKCVSDQYSAYKVNDTMNVNGDLTLGENIADMGGIKESFVAYKAWEKANGDQASPVPGITDDQLFFLSYAQSWCSVRTPEIDVMYATVDPHSPPRYRVNGPLSDLPEFANAFQCKKGSAMNPDKQCTVW